MFTVWSAVLLLSPLADHNGCQQPFILDSIRQHLTAYCSAVTTSLSSVKERAASKSSGSHKLATSCPVQHLFTLAMSESYSQGVGMQASVRTTLCSPKGRCKSKQRAESLGEAARRATHRLQKNTHTCTHSCSSLQALSHQSTCLPTHLFWSCFCPMRARVTGKCILFGNKIFFS